jgi:thiamine-monophosphate kinase
MIDELRALKSIKECFKNDSGSVALGIGDDSAAVSFSPGNLVLATTDSQVEGTHFFSKTLTPRVLGRKSVAVAVSDIAAMGGLPRYILVSAGFSGDLDENYLDQLINGFKDAESEFDVKVIGGNLTSSHNTFIDITVLGEVSKANIIKRTGASSEELIFVTGTLGDSFLGLKLLQENLQTDYGHKYLIDRHIYPKPRLSVGKSLGEARLATSMIDVSDGFLLDLSRISQEYGLGAEIILDNLPLSDEYLNYYSKFSEDLYELALSGGEDYELLFTSPSENLEKIMLLADETGIRITRLGSITSNPEIVLFDKKGMKKEITKQGYIHFTK